MSHKTLIGGFIFISAVLLFISLIHSSKSRPQSVVPPVRADQEKINITMNPKTGTVDTKPKQITILIQPEHDGKKISGIDLTFNATGVLKIIDISKPSSFPQGDSNIFSQIGSNITDQTAHISYVIAQGDKLLPQTIKLQVTVAATTSGVGELLIDQNSMQIVGRVPGYVYGVGTIDQSKFTTPPSSDSVPTSQTESLTLKVRLQGVKNVAPASKQISIEVVFINQQTHNQYIYNVPVSYDGSAYWRGNIPITVPPGDSYIALVKAPLHLQKKVCDLVTHSAYKCPDAHTFTISQSENILDLTSSSLVAGDVRGSQLSQDGVIDAFDIAFIKNQIGQTSAEVVSRADLNFDGIVDSQDYSLALSAVGHKGDE